MRNFDIKNIRYIFIYLQPYQLLYRLLSAHIFLRLSQYVNNFMVSLPVMLLMLFY